MLGYANTLPYCTTLKAETKAIHLGLSCAVQHHLNKLVVEIDSWEAIAVITGFEECPHGSLDMIHDIQRWLTDLVYVDLKCVLPDANKSTYSFSSHALHNQCFELIFVNMSSFAMSPIQGNLDNLDVFSHGK